MSTEIGSIGAIFISVAPADLTKPARGGFEITTLHSGVLVAGNGICSTDGRLDRYFGPDRIKSRGAFPPDKGRQLSIITWDAIERANAIAESSFTWSETRRNVVLFGMTAEELNQLSNQKFSLGGVEIEGTGLCEPCDRPASLSGKKGFKSAFTTENGESMGGIRAKILTTGTINVGETVYI